MRTKHSTPVVVAIALLVALNIVLLAALYACRAERGAGEPFAKTGKYTLYVGLNDKDAFAQLIPTDEAEARLNAVAAKYVDGFTAFRARGYWTDDSGMAAGEETLVYLFFDAREAVVLAMAEEMRIAMNQSAVLVEKDEALVAHLAGAGR